MAKEAKKNTKKSTVSIVKRRSVPKKTSIGNSKHSHPNNKRAQREKKGR